MIINVDVTGNVVIDVSRESISLDVDGGELVNAMGGADEILPLLDYSDIVEYVAEQDRLKMEEIADGTADR